MQSISRRPLLLLLGAGIAFGLSCGQASAGDREAVVEMVEAAARAMAEHGFPQALSRSHPESWFRPAAGLYVFVMDQQGTLLLHPNRSMEGRRVLASVDPDGKPFIREIIARAAARPEGSWTSYLWPSATTGEMGTKHTYSKRVDDLIVSAGYVALDV